MTEDRFSSSSPIRVTWLIYSLHCPGLYSKMWTRSTEVDCPYLGPILEEPLLLFTVNDDVSSKFFGRAHNQIEGDPVFLTDCEVLS